MQKEEILQWLLDGDVSIQYQVYRDLLGTNKPGLQNRIGKEGWGAQFLSKRKADGDWGDRYYQPKWISTHYTLLDLRNLNISPNHKLIKASIECSALPAMIHDATSKPPMSHLNSDICVNGMFLNFASYFKTKENKLQSTVDYILTQHMTDGGFNCRLNRSGAKHSSFHSTLSVLEGISTYEKCGYQYRLDELKVMAEAAKEFLLIHQFFISDRTGKLINKDFLKFAYPRRWRYDILSALDYFQYSGTAWDKRMLPAIEVLLKKRNKKRTWNVNAKHPGQTHFDMERAGQPSRWNTLRALRVLSYYDIDY